MQAVSQTGADRGLFAEVARGGPISYRVLYRFDRETLEAQVARYSRNIFAQALASRKPVRVENALDDPRFAAQESIVERANAASQELAESRETLARDWSFGRFIGRSAVVRELEQQLLKASAT